MHGRRRRQDLACLAIGQSLLAYRYLAKSLRVIRIRPRLHACPYLANYRRRKRLTTTIVAVAAVPRSISRNGCFCRVFFRRVRRGRFAASSSSDNRESRPLACQRARPRLLSLRTSALLGIDEPLQKYIARKQTLSSPASERESRRVIEPEARESRGVCVCPSPSHAGHLSCARSRSSGTSLNPCDRVRRHRGGEYRRPDDHYRGGAKHH